MALLKTVHFFLTERSKPPTPRLYPKKDADPQKKDHDTTPKKEAAREVKKRDLSKDLARKERTPQKKETPKREKDEHNKQEKAAETKKVNNGRRLWTGNPYLLPEITCLLVAICG